jgi:hypothetical protein
MKGNCEESEQHQTSETRNETWGCPLLLPVPTWSLFPMFLSLVSIRLTEPQLANRLRAHPELWSPGGYKRHRSWQGKILECSVIKDSWKVA